MNKLPGAIIIEGHIQGLSNTRSLGEIGIPVIVVDKTDCIAKYSKYCRKYFKCPEYISDKFAYFLIDLAQKENLKNWVLIPSNDHAVYTISKFKTVLSNYYNVITPNITIIDQIYDKATLLKKADNLKIPIPKTITGTQDTNSIDYFPVILKGRKGLDFYKATGQKAFIANDIQELKNLYSTIKIKIDLCETITQELIPLNYIDGTISFTAFVDKGEIKTYWIGEKLREHPIRFGTATFCRSIKKPLLYEPSANILKDLRYTGICEIEYIIDPRDGEYKLIEINPRTWLWIDLAKNSGINYMRLLADYFTTKSVKYPSHYSIEYNWLNLLTDVPFSILSILTRRLSIKEYVISFRKKVLFAVLARNDILPAIVHPFVLLFNIKKRKKIT